MGADGADGAVRELAPAKVNLFLHVLGRRADGYHELESLAVFPGLGDVVEVEAGTGLSLAMDGPFAGDLGAGGDNLAAAAAERLRARTGARGGAAIRLSKNLPIASGVGGGSADAAATLRALIRLWPEARREDGAALAAGLGADVPVCFVNRPAIMRGAGERLSPAPGFPAFWMVLANPRAQISTAEVFGDLDGAPPPIGPKPPRRFIDFGHLVSWLSAQRNDLEAPARRLRPVVGKVLSAIAWNGDCALARMSGSGATCFGLFETEAAALGAAETLRRAEPGWWIAAAPVDRWEDGAWPG